MERKNFIIKNQIEQYSINWKKLGGFNFLTTNTLIEAIAVQLLEYGKDFVCINFCGLYSSPENDNEQSLLVDKIYYVLFEIDGKYMILNISEPKSPLIEIEICWIGYDEGCSNKCRHAENCKLIKMKSEGSYGKLYFKNKLIN